MLFIIFFSYREHPRPSIIEHFSCGKHAKRILIFALFLRKSGTVLFLSLIIYIYIYVFLICNRSRIVSIVWKETLRARCRGTPSRITVYGPKDPSKTQPVHFLRVRIFRLSSMKIIVTQYYIPLHNSVSIQSLDLCIFIYTDRNMFTEWKKIYI